MFSFSGLSGAPAFGPAWYGTECICRIIGDARSIRSLTVNIRPICFFQTERNCVSMSINPSLYCEYSSKWRLTSTCSIVSLPEILRLANSVWPWSFLGLLEAAHYLQTTFRRFYSEYSCNVVIQTSGYFMFIKRLLFCRGISDEN